MKYLIVGTGGTGGAMGGYLQRAGKDVTFIARGEHLRAMRENGLRIIRPEDEFVLKPVQAMTMEEYAETPDVVFVCVKGYSMDSVIPFLQRIAGPDTVVIPILNIIGTGSVLKESLPDVPVMDGCIYVASEILESGVLRMNGNSIRVVFGARTPEEEIPVLKEIEAELNESGIRGICSADIRRDAMVKFSYVSSQAACGLHYGNCPAGPMQKEGEERECFIALIREIQTLGEAMGIRFEDDLVPRNLKILDALTPEASTSLQRDIASGRPSEIDGLLYLVLRLAKEYDVAVPVHEMIAEEMRSRGL